MSRKESFEKRRFDSFEKRMCEGYLQSAVGTCETCKKRTDQQKKWSQFKRIEEKNTKRKKSQVKSVSSVGLESSFLLC